MPDISLVVFDMAGTTVADGGIVEAAFTKAAYQVGLARTRIELADMLGYVRATMGESKIEVFRHLADDEPQAQRANLAFESAYTDSIRDDGCQPLPGAEESFARLREGGCKVALTTGFSGTTQDAILDALGWHDLVDLALCPADAGRGRPYPDLPLTALIRTQTTGVQNMAVVGDTAYDVLSGLRSGATLVAGVLTGAHNRVRLTDAGATHVLSGVTEVVDLVLQPAGALGP